MEQAASKVKKILEPMSGATMKLLDYTKKRAQHTSYQLHGAESLRT
jgi:hypothetical protein